MQEVLGIKDYFLNLFAGLFDLDVFGVDLVDHLGIEDVVVVSFEGVFVEDGLSVLPYGFLNVLHKIMYTFTRILINWSR